MITTLSVGIFGVLGALIGSFANVVIYRLPRRESIVFPGSHCPTCQHRLSPLELVPVISWLALGGRCRVCKTRIGVRYPVIELLTAVAFMLIAWRWPLFSYGPTPLVLLAILTFLMIAAAIDLDHLVLPDVLTLPAVIIAIAGTALYPPEAGLPGLHEALTGSAIGAGIVVLINRIGGLFLRRFADTEERLWPLGLDQVNIAALAGVVGGWQVGVAAAGASIIINLLTGRTLRLPEAPVYALWLLAALLDTAGILPVGAVGGIGGSLAAAGTIALTGAAYWWLGDLIQGRSNTSSDPPEEEVEAGIGEPVAMGFGDVKLAAVLGGLLGWEKMLVALFLAFFIGALGGIAGRLTGGRREIPFGPYLVLGGVVSLFFGGWLLAWYLGFLSA